VSPPARRLAPPAPSPLPQTKNNAELRRYDPDAHKLLERVFGAPRRGGAQPNPLSPNKPADARKPNPTAAGPDAAPEEPLVAQHHLAAVAEVVPQRSWHTVDVGPDGTVRVVFSGDGGAATAKRH